MVASAMLYGQEVLDVRPDVVVSFVVGVLIFDLCFVVVT